MKIILGITGASGAIYGYTLLRLLHAKGVQTDLILTAMGEKVLQYECGISRQDLAGYATLYENNNLFAPIASGSCLCDGMVVAPCSMNTLGLMANGLGGTLLTRCAAVTLKEQRPLVLLTRETPLNTIQIENMLRAARAGAVVMPASPGFYQKPQHMSELIAGVVFRVLDKLNIPAEEASRWK